MYLRILSHTSDNPLSMMLKRAALFLSMFLVPPAQAASTPWTLSGLLGYGIGEHDFASYSWGAAAEYKIDPDWEAGVGWTATTDAPRTLIPIMFTVNYYGTGMRGFYVGPRIGITAIKTDAVGVSPSISSSEFTWGAHLGYDHPINSEWSWGLNASLNLAMSDDPNGIFNLVVPIKYQF